MKKKYLNFFKLLIISILFSICFVGSIFLIKNIDDLLTRNLILLIITIVFIFIFVIICRKIIIDGIGLKYIIFPIITFVIYSLNLVSFTIFVLVTNIIDDVLASILLTIFIYFSGVVYMIAFTIGVYKELNEHSERKLEKDELEISNQNILEVDLTKTIEKPRYKMKNFVISFFIGLGVSISIIYIIRFVNFVKNTRNETGLTIYSSNIKENDVTEDYHDDFMYQ